MSMRALLAADRAPIGTWIMSGSPDVAEAMACRDFDFLVIDMEHVAITVERVLHIARAVEARGKVPVVRLAHHDTAHIRWMLDAGLNAIMVPMIDTVEHARTVAQAMDYPPGGSRGFAAMLRANAYNADPTYAAEARERITFIAQLETPRALDALEDIAAVPGVDALFLGPGDISATTGHLGNATGDATLGLIRSSIARCGKAGVPVGTVMPRADLARDMLDAGASFAAVGSDMGFAAAGAAAAVDAIRNGTK